MSFLINSYRFGGGAPTDYIARYTMDDIVGSTVNDETGNYDATISNTSTTTGQDGTTALDFSGSTSALMAIPDDAAFEINEGTVSMWLYFPTNISAILIEKDANAGWTIQSSGGGAYIRHSRGNDTTGMRATMPTAATWFHLVVLMSDTQANREIYLDAVASSYQQTTGTPTFGAGDVNIGVRPTAIAPFAGYMDNIRIYNRLLSPSEITAIYNEEL